MNPSDETPEDPTDDTTLDDLVGEIWGAGRKRHKKLAPRGGAGPKKSVAARPGEENLALLTRLVRMILLQAGYQNIESHRIEALKKVREALNVGLREGRDFVYQICFEQFGIGKTAGAAEMVSLERCGIALHDGGTQLRAFLEGALVGMETAQPVDRKIAAYEEDLQRRRHDEDLLRGAGPYSGDSLTPEQTEQIRRALEQQTPGDEHEARELERMREYIRRDLDQRAPEESQTLLREFEARYRRNQEQQARRQIRRDNDRSTMRYTAPADNNVLIGYRNEGLASPNTLLGSSAGAETGSAYGNMGLGQPQTDWSSTVQRLSTEVLRGSSQWESIQRSFAAHETPEWLRRHAWIFWREGRPGVDLVIDRHRSDFAVEHVTQIGIPDCTAAQREGVILGMAQEAGLGRASAITQHGRHLWGVRPITGYAWWNPDATGSVDGGRTLGMIPCVEFKMFGVNGWYVRG